MKATGIVRRIDDLGRVVIPKEIRKTMRIREGDPLEIFTDRDGEVIFKKYSPIGELGDFASQYAETLSKTSGQSVCITDKDTVVAVSGASKKELLDKKVTSTIEQLLEDRISYYLKHTEDKKVYLLDMSEKYIVSVCVPIIAEGDAIGNVIFFSTDTPIVMSDIENKLAQNASLFLGRQMEE